MSDDITLYTQYDPCCSKISFQHLNSLKIQYTAGNNINIQNSNNYNENILLVE